MALPPEKERELGPIRTTGYFLCNSVSRFVRKPLVASYMNPRSVIPAMALIAGYFLKPLGSRRYSQSGLRTK